MERPGYGMTLTYHLGCFYPYLKKLMPPNGKIKGIISQDEPLKD